MTILQGTKNRYTYRYHHTNKEDTINREYICKNKLIEDAILWHYTTTPRCSIIILAK